MDELKAGGFSQQFREKVLDAATTGYMRMWRGEKEGKGYVNRPERDSRMKRRWTKLLGKTTWFNREKESQSTDHPKKKGKAKTKTEGVLYVPYTQNSLLKRKMQQMEDNIIRNKLTGRIRVIERNGKTVAETSSNPVPWRGTHCGHAQCQTCKTK